MTVRRVDFIGRTAEGRCDTCGREVEAEFGPMGDLPSLDDPVECEACWAKAWQETVVDPNEGRAGLLEFTPRGLRRKK